MKSAAFSREDFAEAWERYNGLWGVTATPADRLRAMDVDSRDFGLVARAIHQASEETRADDPSWRLFDVALCMFGLGYKLGELRASREEVAEP